MNDIRGTEPLYMGIINSSVGLNIGVPQTKRDAVFFSPLEPNVSFTGLWLQTCDKGEKSFCANDILWSLPSRSGLLMAFLISLSIVLKALNMQTCFCIDARPIAEDSQSDRQ